MKIQVMKTLFLLSLMMGIANVTARAQGLIDDTAIEADVPHAFIVRNTTLPAGKYTIKRVDYTQPNALEIRSADGRRAVIFETESTRATETPRQAEFVFDRFLTTCEANSLGKISQIDMCRRKRQLAECFP